METFGGNLCPVALCLSALASLAAVLDTHRVWPQTADVLSLARRAAHPASHRFSHGGKTKSNTDVETVDGVGWCASRRICGIRPCAWPHRKQTTSGVARAREKNGVDARSAGARCRLESGWIALRRRHDDVTMNCKDRRGPENGAHRSFRRRPPLHTGLSLAYGTQLVIRRV
jgi:hypothetical protein